jgi:hypothetical protein
VLTPGRKQQLSNQNSELEALEARIREMEERLKNPQRMTPLNAAVASSSSPTPQTVQRSSPASSPRHVRSPLGDTFHQQQQQERPSSHHRNERAAPHHQQQGRSEREYEHRYQRPAPLAKPPSRGAEQARYGGSRPGTARASQQAVPGALPPTPVASEGECAQPGVGCLRNVNVANCGMADGDDYDV